MIETIGVLIAFVVLGLVYLMVAIAVASFLASVDPGTPDPAFRVLALLLWPLALLSLAIGFGIRVGSAAVRLARTGRKGDRP